MQDKIWDSLLDRLELKYGEVSVKHREESREDDMGNALKSDISYVDFSMPEGNFRVEKVVTPMILDKKTHYSHSSGNHTSIEYVLSPDEKSTKIRAFRENPDTGEWEELSTNNLAF